jgi:hypothetical protein
MEGQPEALWALARRLAERGHPVAVLPAQVLLVGPVGTALPAAASVELRFTAGDSPEEIFQELVRRGIVR